MKHNNLFSKASLALFVLAAVGFFSMCAGAVSAHAEQIDSFNSVLQVQKDGTLNVTETIVYNPEGVAHHGILRNIPLQNAQGGSMQISSILVTDESGNAYQFSQSGWSTIDLKIGDPSSTFTEPKTYVISYALTGVYSY